jgi:hypothetical protein
MGKVVMQTKSTMKNKRCLAGLMVAELLLGAQALLGQQAVATHPPLLIASYSSNAAYIEAQGVKWPIVHSAELLPNGNLLIGGAYGAPVIEVDKADRIVWKLTPEDIPDVGFAYSAGCLRLPNGNTVVAAYTSKFPVFEVTPEKKLVWRFQNPAVGHPTHVKVLAPVDVERFLNSKGK